MDRRIEQLSPTSRGPIQVLLWVGAPFRRVWRWFAHQPRALQVGLIVVLVAALAVCGFFGRSYLKKRGNAKEIATAWSEYNLAAAKVDLDGIRAALDHVLAIDPNDGTAIRYKVMLDREEADPDVHELAVALLYHHIRNQRFTEAAREADKVLAKNPKNWQARCALAYHALHIQKDRALAEAQLAQLPDPDDPAAQVIPAGLHFALMISSDLGRDASDLRRFIVRRLLPILRGETIQSASPSTKSLLLACYIAAFADQSSLNELADYWAAADKLAESAVNEAIASGDVTIIAHLATLGRGMRLGLRALRDNDRASLPDDRFATLLKANDDRTRRAWLAVREKAPDRIDAYRELANLALMENNHRGAMDQVMQGLAACGYRAELLELLVPLEKSIGTDKSLLEAVRVVWKDAEDAKTDATKWCLAANGALALNEFNSALYACRKARELQADHPVACQTEAGIWIRSGNFLLAREALVPLGETALRTQPGLIQLHARALAETLWILIDDEYKAVLEAQAKMKTKTAAPTVAFLYGVLTATPSAERAEWVAARAAGIPSDDPTASFARRIRVEALYRLAEMSVTTNPQAGPPVWNLERVNAALRGIEAMSPDERAEPPVAAAVAALQLKGQGNAPAALRTVNALRAVEASLDPRQLEVLGAVLTANGKAAEAVKVLERAVKLARPSAGLRVALARAYHKNNQIADARAEIGRAEDTPDRSAREQAELVEMKQLLLRENP